MVALQDDLASAMHEAGGKDLIVEAGGIRVGHWEIAGPVAPSAFVGDGLRAEPVISGGRRGG
jgi:hypothetical protein